MYEKPVFMIGALREFKLVTGGWSIFVDDGGG